MAYERRNVPWTGTNQKGGGYKEKKNEKGGDSKMEGLMAQFKTYTEVVAQKAKVKERVAEEGVRVAGEKVRVAGEKVRVAEEKVRVDKEKNKLKEWDIMTTDVESYSEQKRATLKKMQEKIMKKYES
ncbi:hypothetical protein Hanom_Chr05g00450161 [Helianthus anomalus]